MTIQTIITGHEAEVAQLEIDAASAETRALTFKLSGEALAACGETLRLAARGLLTRAEIDIFGERQSVEQQVADAEASIIRHMTVLSKVVAA